MTKLPSEAHRVPSLPHGVRVAAIVDRETFLAMKNEQEVLNTNVHRESTAIVLTDDCERVRRLAPQHFIDLYSICGQRAKAVCINRRLLA